jgi:hypothetical protein
MNMKNQNTNSPAAELTTYNDLSLRQLSAACSSKLNALKNQLVKRLTAEFSGVEAHLVSQAVTEAQALAELTVVPHLLLPTLAEEKVRGVSAWARHQQAVNPQFALAHAA